MMGIQSSIDSIQFFLKDGIAEHDLPAVGTLPFNQTYMVPQAD